MIDKIIGVANREPDTLIPRITGNTITKCDKGIIIANTLANPFSLYKVVSLSEKPVSFDTFKSGDSDVRLTRGIYTICYVPKSNKNKRPYRISQDLLGGCFTVYDFQHWCKCAACIPELGWIKRNSTLNQELFGLAKCHPGLGLQFTIDWVKYAKKINEKAEAEHINIEHRPFVAYHCSYQDFDDKYRTKTVGPKKTVLDYKETFKNLDKEFEEK